MNEQNVQIESTTDDSLWAAVARRKSLVVILGSAALFALALVAYWPALRGEFIWDDDHYVSNNADLRTLEGLQHLWMPPQRGATTQYYPMVLTSFWIEYHLWGLNPIGYHVVNVLLHALGATLLWTLLRRLNIPGAWAAAAIFALHPVHVESVAWVSERKNVLSGVFYFTTMLVLLRYLKVTPAPAPDSKKQWWSLPDDPTRVYGLVAVLFACALLSKSVTATLPAAALIIVWWKRDGRITWDDVAPLLPLLALGAVSAWYTAHLEASPDLIGASGKDWDYAPTFIGEVGARSIIAGRVAWFYLVQLIAPFPLIFNYPRWNITATNVLLYLFPLFAVAALVALWGLRDRLGRGPFGAALVFVVSLVPVMGFFNVYPFRYSFVADHFNYLSSVPMIVLIVAGLKRGCDRLASIQVLNPAAAPAGAAILLLALGILTRRQSEMYQNMSTLWRTTLLRNEKSWMASNNYGLWIMTSARLPPAERLDSAEKWFLRTIRLKPDHPEARLNLGLVALKRGQDREALHWFQESLAQNPNYAPAQFNAARLLMAMGQSQQALALYQKLVQQQPDYPDAALNLAVLLAKMNRVPEAIEYYRKAVELDPESVLAHMALGSAYFDVGQLPAAAEEFDIVTKLDPKNAQARILLGKLAMEKKRPDIAGPYFMQAIEADPNNAEAWNYVGYVYEVLDKFDRAIDAFTHACELAPDNFDYLANLRRAVEELKKHPATQPATTRSGNL